MTTAARPPSWFPPLSLVAMVFVTWAISFTPQFIAPSPLVPFTSTAQLLVFLILGRAFCYWPPMARWVGSMPVAHRVVFGVLIGAMILGHYTIRGRAWYPFIVWEIFPFVHDGDPVTAREFIATTGSGQQVRLLPEQLFPSIVQVDPLDSLDDPHLYPAGTTDALARALAHAYNEQHPDDKVRMLDLYTMAVRLHPPAGEVRTQPSCELLKHFDFSSAQ